MTPYEFACSLAEQLRKLNGFGADLPEPVNCQLGDIVVDCQGTIVSVMNKTETEVTPGAPECGIIEIADIVVTAARECANVANQDGTTDHAALNAVSAAMDHDGALLEEWAAKLMADSWFRLTRPTITYSIQGGLAFVTLAMSLPIP